MCISGKQKYPFDCNTSAYTQTEERKAGNVSKDDSVHRYVALNGKDVEGYPVRNGKLMEICEQGSEIDKRDTVKFIFILWQVGLNQGTGNKKKKDCCKKKSLYI